MTFSEFDPDIQAELLATARRAAARFQGRFPGLLDQWEDITQDSYVTVLSEAPRLDIGRGNIYAYAYKACLRSLICGWRWRRDYRMQRTCLPGVLPDHGFQEKADVRAAVTEALPRVGLTPLESAVLAAIYWDGRNDRETAEYLGYTTAWINTTKQVALRRVRAAMGAAEPERVDGGHRTELSTKRSARHMRRVSARKEV